MADVTQTKRKAILREMSGHRGSVTYGMITTLASRYQISHIAIRNVLTQAAYVCEPPPQHDQPSVIPPRPRVEKLPLPLTYEEYALIKSGRLYRLIDSDSDFVVVRRDLFEKERAVIIKLMAMFAEPHGKA